MGLFHTLISEDVQLLPSIFSGMQVWHTLSDQVGSPGSTITSVSDISGNGLTGTVSGSQRTLSIESNGLKSLSSNGTNDKIQFNSTGMQIRTVAVLVKQNSGQDRWADYYGFISKETSGGNDFSIAANATLPGTGETGRQFLRPVGTYTSIQTDNILPSYYPFGTMAINGDFAPMQEYHLVIFELSATVTADTSTISWLQERNVGGRYFKANFCDGIVWNRTLSSIEKNNLYQWFLGKRRYKNIYLSPNNVILDGNSLAIGATAVYSSAPIKLALTTLGANYTGGSIGYGSALMDDLYSRFNNVPLLKKRSGFTKNIYLAWEISNFLATGRGDATACFNWYKSLYDLARSSGFIVIGTTCIDRRGSLSISQGTFDSYRASVNASVLAYHAGLSEQVADFSANVNLQNASNATYFNGDQIHLTTAGYTIVGTILSNAISLV